MEKQNAVATTVLYVAMIDAPSIRIVEDIKNGKEKKK
jgi:hypothetical protein